MAMIDLKLADSEDGGGTDSLLRCAEVFLSDTTGIMFMSAVNKWPAERPSFATRTVEMGFLKT